MALTSAENVKIETGATDANGRPITVRSTPEGKLFLHFEGIGDKPKISEDLFTSKREALAAVMRYTLENESKLAKAASINRGIERRKAEAEAA